MGNKMRIEEEDDDDGDDDVDDDDNDDDNDGDHDENIVYWESLPGPQAQFQCLLAIKSLGYSNSL